MRTTIILLILTAVLTGCNREAKVTDDDLTFITEDEVKSTLAKYDRKGKGVLLLDSRSAENYDDGHIENAINVQSHEIQPDIPTLTGYKIYIVYGRDWFDPIPLALSKRLIACRYGKVLTYKEGLADWLKKGNTITPTE